MIHLNNAGASIASDETLQIMIGHLHLEQTLGGYEAAAAKSVELEDFYDQAAKLIGCDANEIAFSDSASRAWNNLVFSMDFAPGDKIITSEIEYGNNVLSLQRLAEKHDVELIRLPVDEEGCIDLNDLKSQLDDNVKLVAVSHAPAHCGTVLNVREIGRCLTEHSAVYLVDVCQTLGQVDVNVTDIGCDALVATGRKWLRGPRGTAFMFISDELASSLNSNSIGVANAKWSSETKNGSHLSYTQNARRFECWERSMAAQLGLVNAINEARQKDVQKSISQTVQRFRSQLETSIATNAKLHLYPGNNTQSGILTFHHNEKLSSTLKTELAQQGINVSVAGEWLAPWDYNKKKLPDLVRISAHYINTQDEIDAVCLAITRL